MKYMKKRIALVLEGGGMRGAYTAGALSWLIDHNIDFSSIYGISTGAIHASSFLLKEKNYLHDLSTKHIADKQVIGWRPFLREGRLVGYRYLFHHFLPNIFHYDIHRLKEVAKGKNAKIGVYDLQLGETVYIQLSEIDDDFLLLRAAGTLPVIGSVVNYQGKRYFDGGITEMIPIREAMDDQNEKFLIITTKPGNYQRKPANKWVVKFMSWFYSYQPKIAKQYEIRHLNYQQQIQQIKDLVSEEKAIYMFPSREIPVSRLKGDNDKLEELYQLGYQDMEKRKDEILAFLKEEEDD